MTAPRKPNQEGSGLGKIVDQVRNEMQKSVLLSEVARLNQQRSSRAMEESRKTCGRAQNWLSRRSSRKRG